MKYNDNGEIKDIKLKTLDTLPVGAVIDYDGDTVPDGWVETSSYSTNEINTGKKWINGKPIYRKVITGTTPTSNYRTFITIENLDMLIDANITVDFGGSYAKIPFIDLVSNIYFDYYISGNDLRTHFSASNYGNKPFTAIVEYTKTTDVALANELSFLSIDEEEEDEN